MKTIQTAASVPPIWAACHPNCVTFNQLLVAFRPGGDPGDCVLGVIVSTASVNVPVRATMNYEVKNVEPTRYQKNIKVKH